MPHIQAQPSASNYQSALTQHAAACTSVGGTGSRLVLTGQHESLPHVSHVVLGAAEALKMLVCVLEVANAILNTASANYQL